MPVGREPEATVGATVGLPPDFCKGMSRATCPLTLAVSAIVRVSAGRSVPGDGMETCLAISGRVGWLARMAYAGIAVGSWTSGAM